MTDGHDGHDGLWGLIIPIRKDDFIFHKIVSYLLFYRLISLYTAHMP